MRSKVIGPAEFAKKACGLAKSTPVAEDAGQASKRIITKVHQAFWHVAEIAPLAVGIIRSAPTKVIQPSPKSSVRQVLQVLNNMNRCDRFALLLSGAQTMVAVQDIGAALGADHCRGAPCRGSEASPALFGNFAPADSHLGRPK